MKRPIGWFMVLMIMFAAPAIAQSDEGTKSTSKAPTSRPSGGLGVQIGNDIKIEIGKAVADAKRDVKLAADDLKNELTNNLNVDLGNLKIQIIGDKDKEKDKNVRMEKVAHLGLTASSVPSLLRVQMKLERGIGLVVDFVEKGSPAEAAGVQRYDLLMKMNDQIMVGQQQYTILLRTMKPGDEVTLAIIREGQPMKLKAKLGEKEQRVTDDTNPWLLPPQIAPGAGTIKNTQKGKEQSLKWSDDKYTLLLTMKDKEKRLQAQDAQGKTIFDGPVVTEDQRKKLSKDVRDRLEQLEKAAERMQSFVEEAPATPAAAPTKDKDKSKSK